MSGDTPSGELVSVGDTRVENAIEVNKVKISNWRGMVCLTFEKRCDALTLTAQESLVMSEALARQSYRAAHGDFPDGGTKQNLEQLRIRARDRMVLLLRATMKAPPKTEQAFKLRAAALVDEVMKLVS